MKKYFKSEDILVILTMIFCLMWIIMFKIYWINQVNSWISNADVWGEITYTILTSILAACFFYGFAEFFPKVLLIKRMKKDLLDHMNKNEVLLEMLSESIISQTMFNKETQFDFIRNNEEGEFDNYKYQIFEKTFVEFGDTNNGTYSLIQQIFVRNSNGINEIYSRYLNVLTEELKVEIMSVFDIGNNYPRQYKNNQDECLFTYVGLCEIKEQIEKFRSIL